MYGMYKATYGISTIVFESANVNLYCYVHSTNEPIPHLHLVSITVNVFG